MIALVFFILGAPFVICMRHLFVKSLILANFKDFNVEASFFGPMAIAIPFQKPRAISFHMPPSYGPLKQWLNKVLQLIRQALEGV